MNVSRRPLTDMLKSLPPEWPNDPLPAIATALQARREKVVVLDDDPTGTQTVHGVPVLTQWPVEALRAELANDLPVCFLLTNSRSLPLPQPRRSMPRSDSIYSRPPHWRAQASSS